MNKTYYTKTDGGEFIASHIGFDQMSGILATIMADQMRDMIVTKIGDIIDGSAYRRNAGSARRLNHGEGNIFRDFPLSFSAFT